MSWITSGSELCELSPKKWTHKECESGIKKERVEKMEKFTKEEKELLEQNPNIQAVLSNQVLYTKDFKEKAVIEYESGKSANPIFKEAEIDISILSKRYDYASKIISKWRVANREKINIHYPKRKYKQKESSYQKLLERNEYLEAENTNGKRIKIKSLLKKF